MNQPFVAAVVQASPVFFDKTRTLEKIDALTKEAAANKARLVLFPEVFIPGYPRGLSFGTTIGNRTAEGRDLFLHYWENAISIPGADVLLLEKIARDHQVFLAVGVTEKDTISDTLYCSLLIFSPEGTLLYHHRKIKPTAAERFIWGEGDGTDLKVVDSSIGKIGGLICWENYMPLARTALYEQGIELYLAPTADSRETWQATLTHIACESRSFVLGCNQVMTQSNYPPDIQKLFSANNSGDCAGGSVIISPLGKILAGPLYNKEGILYAEIDHNEIVRAKMDLDVIGHYARPDIFKLQWKNK